MMQETSLIPGTDDAMARGVATREGEAMLLLCVLTSQLASWKDAGPACAYKPLQCCGFSAAGPAQTVTVSTLPVLRENDISWSGAPPPAAAAESRLLLFVRSELPGRVAVQDDLDNTELPFFTLGQRGGLACGWIPALAGLPVQPKGSWPHRHLPNPSQPQGSWLLRRLPKVAHRKVSIVFEAAVLIPPPHFASCLQFRIEMPRLEFVGRVLLLLSNAARDADEEVPQDSGRMKLN
ncbi:hypothetical protein BTVI_64461 [Pitangus sulphuratus]|nr:hypothetical protein BTVI_64461 [Pitangus sulphuratus]